MSAQEVANLCGLSPDEGFLAKEREYDEPFVLENKKLAEQIQKIAGEDHLQVVESGRFFHLMGDNDKGKAVTYITDISRRAHDRITTIALGDSQVDLPMLQVVDYPILVKKPDGSYDPNVTLENLIQSPKIGPEGWNHSLLELLDKLT